MDTASVSKGILYLVATPIGNLEDITLRALRTLREVDYIAAEDTRRTRKLLSHYDIHTKLVSYHEHIEKKRSDELLKYLLAGHTIALVSDAGIPGISDPGFRVIERAIAHGITVYAIPGPSAIMTALCVSGLTMNRFCFFGFPPRRQGARRELLEDMKHSTSTLVFYESPRRVEQTLSDMLLVLGNRRAAVCRELTKQHEEVMRGTLRDLLRQCRNRELRGEVCILVEGSASGLRACSIESLDVLHTLKEVQEKSRLGLKEAVKEVAKRYGVSQRQLYQLALTHKDRSSAGNRQE